MKALMKVAPGVGNVELCDIAEPSPGQGQVVIEVKAAGICGTDLHIYDDEYKTRPPVVMGHEVAGTIASLGEGTVEFEVGERVTTETYFSVCGTCRSCRAGLVNLCWNRLSIGSGVNGGFAKYLVVPSANLHRLPDHVTFEAGALTEPVACCLHALELTRLMPDDVVVVSGPGTIGLIMAQIAKAAGARVIMLGTRHDELRLAKAIDLGIDLAMNVEASDPEAFVREVEAEGADVVLECSGAAASARTCLNLVRRKGHYCQVGLFGKPIQLDVDQVCFKEVSVSGSYATVPWVWKKAVSIIAEGKVDTESLVSDTYRLEEWVSAFDRFRSKVGFKHVFLPG